MPSRTQITIDPDLRRRAAAKAEQLGVSFAEYVRRALQRDLGPEAQRDFDITAMFDLFDDGPATDIARDKDKMVGEAVWREHQRKIGAKVSSRNRQKATQK
jgi:hypothetical protein